MIHINIWSFTCRTPSSYFSSCANAVWDGERFVLRSSHTDGFVPVSREAILGLREAFWEDVQKVEELRSMRSGCDGDYDPECDDLIYLADSILVYAQYRGRTIDGKDDVLEVLKEIFSPTGDDFVRSFARELVIATAEATRVNIGNRWNPKYPCDDRHRCPPEIAMDAVSALKALEEALGIQRGIGSD